MKTIKLFKVVIQSSIESFDAIKFFVCRFNGAMYTDFQSVIHSHYDRLTLEQCIDLVKTVYDDLDTPVVEVAIIRDQQGNPIEFNPETLMPYVASENKEE